MGVATTLDQRPLAVEPGSTLDLRVSVVNTGSLVDAIQFVVLGEPGGWASVSPDVVRALPGDSHEVVVRFAPPRSSAVSAGPKPFAVRAISREDAAGSSVAEGVIEVLPFHDLSIELVPRTRHAMRRATFEYAVDNRGNVPVELEVAAIDPEQFLNFRVRQPVLNAPPGTATFGKAVATVPRLFLRGADKSFPFRVVARPGNDSPLLADGTLMQRAVFPKWAPKGILALLALLLVLAGLYRLLVKNLLGDVAQETAKEEVQAVQQTSDQALKDAQAAKEAAEAAQRSAGAAEEKANDANSKADSAAASATAAANDASRVNQFDQRIKVVEDKATRLEAKDADLQAQVDALKAKDLDLQNQINALKNNPPTPEGFILRTIELQVPNANSATVAAAEAIDFFLTDLVVLNPTELKLPIQTGQPLSGQGQVLITGGLVPNATIVELGLSNFRDVDYHFVSPIEINAANPLTLTVTCTLEPCRVIVKASGYVKRTP